MRYVYYLLAGAAFAFVLSLVIGSAHASLPEASAVPHDRRDWLVLPEQEVEPRKDSDMSARWWRVIMGLSEIGSGWQMCRAVPGTVFLPSRYVFEGINQSLQCGWFGRKN